MTYVDPDLQKVKLLINKEVADYKAKETYELVSDIQFDRFFEENISSKNLKTMVLDYDKRTSILSVQIFEDNTQAVSASLTKFSISYSGYMEFISENLGMDKDAEYNDSSSTIINGTQDRAFAIREPYRDAPLIVISTAKKPPDRILSLDSRVEMILKDVIQSNYLIAGKTGAGKTYLLNYLLSKYFPKDKRLGIIQEFSEIYPPNSFTDLITIPPKKPGQKWNDLQYLTEQSNLMRYDFLLIGEIKSDEAWPFVINAASGVKCGATIHGDDVQHALQRLRTLSLLAKENLNEKIVDTFIARAIEYVILVEDAQVKKIEKINLVNNGTFSTKSLYESNSNNNSNSN